MLTLAYDSLDTAADRQRVHVRPNGAAAAPGAAWLLRLCLLAPDRLGFERTATLTAADRPFVYPLELTTDSRPGAPAPAHPVSLALPPAVCAAARRGRAGILVWLGDRAVPLELDADGQAWLFDLVELVVLKNEIPPASVWFATGTVTAPEDFGAWQRLRGFYEPELFRMRALSAVPGLARATYRAHAQGRAVTQARAPDGGLTLETIAMPPDAFRARTVTPDEIAAEHREGRLRARKLVYLSDDDTPHSRLVLAFLHAAGCLEATVAGFPAVCGDTPGIAAAFPAAPALSARLEAAWQAVAPRLPLVPTGAPSRDGYVAIAGEPTMDGYPLAAESVIAPLLTLQPFLWVGAPDTLRYLRALGFQTFGRVLDERYDVPDAPA
ncbi:MAG: hypothetical protein JO021_17735, partial [Alphaproteobacteria bacterium]|nr:hypothetical protein [Alphaproteobacteria bacterium]